MDRRRDPRMRLFRDLPRRGCDVSATQGSARTRRLNRPGRPPMTVDAQRAGGTGAATHDDGAWIAHETQHRVLEATWTA